MKFTDLILPKWKNSNPLVRLKAVEAIGTDNTELLGEILLSDDAPEIRLSVLKKISDETTLANTSKNDADESVRKAASHKLNLIFAERIIDSDDDATRVTFLNMINDEELLASLSAKIESPDFRISIVNKISSPKLLCGIAESNCGVKAGEAIIDKTNELPILKRISQTASSKKIRKKADEKIKTLKAKQTRQPHPPEPKKDNTPVLENLCEVIESAVTTNDLKQTNKTLIEAKKAWEQNISDNQHQLSERFDNALKVLEQHSIKLAKIENAIQAYTDICSKIKTLTEQTEVGENEKKQLEIHCKEWEELETDSLDNAIFSPLHSDYKSLIFNFNEKYKSFIIQQEKQNTQIDTLKSICDATEALTASEIINTTGQEIINLKKKWDAEYTASEATNEIKEQFTTILKQCEEKIALYQKAEKQRQEEKFITLLSIVKKASEEDEKKLYKIAPEVKNAIKAWNNQKSTGMDSINDLEFQKLCDTFFERLESHQKNREWELWANLSLKNELCSDVEKVALMADNAENLFGYSKLIRDAQAKWKEIGPVSKHKSDEIWEKFKSPCDRVFSRCLEEKNRLLIEAKEAVELNNYNETSAKIVKIQQSWKQIGPLPLSLEKDLRDSFTQLCDDFFAKKRNFIQQKDQERHENYIIKLALCEQAETHIESTDWNKSTEKYKQLQAKWKKTGSVPRDKSDEIWERFSLACNTYFENLEKTKPQNMEIKTKLCEEAESICDSINNDSDIWEACKKIIALQKVWNQTGPAPKESSDTLWEKFRTSCDKAFEMREEAREKLSIDYENNRKEKEVLIYQAEAITEAPNSKSAADELKNVQEKWKTIGPASRKDEQELWAKFRKINDSFFNSRREHFQLRESLRNDNLAIKENLCLNLELLAKILIDNSDIEYNEKVPLAEQLSIARELRESVDIPGDKKATRANIMRKVKEIQTTWKKTGSVPSELESELWARYKKAGDLFYS